MNQLIEVFLGNGPLVVGIDETLERRWGAQIKARSIYRDAVRSSDSHRFGAPICQMQWSTVDVCNVLTKVS